MMKTFITPMTSQLQKTGTDDVLVDGVDVNGVNHSIGQLVQVRDPSGETRYEYNPWGQVARKVYTVDGTRYETQNHYSDHGQLVGITYPSGRTVNYDRDDLGRIAAVNTSANQAGFSQNVVNGIEYLPFGPVAHMQYGNQTHLNIQRDLDYRIQSIQVAANDNVYAKPVGQKSSKAAPSDVITKNHVYYDAGYLYDNSSNIIQISDYLNNQRTQTFEYDDLYRLTDAEGHYGQVSYEYDGVGNRLSRRLERNDQASSELEALIESYEYAHDSNRLLSVAQQQGGDSQTRQLGYDAVGNIVKDSRAQDANLALIYGANNRLQQVEQGVGGASEAAYTYNAKGQRVSKRVVLSDGHVDVIHFHYDMADRLLAETDAQGQVLKEYVYAGAERVAMVDYQQGGEEAGLLFVHNDHLGTPQLMTSMEREVVWRSEVLPFGQALAEANLESMKLGFPGQYWDGETGFRYNYFRDYDAGLGRYVQSDPIGLNGGVNTFGYVGQSPIVYIDPTGKVKWRKKVGEILFVIVEAFTDGDVLPDTGRRRDQDLTEVVEQKREKKPKPNDPDKKGPSSSLSVIPLSPLEFGIQSACMNGIAPAGLCSDLGYSQPEVILPEC